MGSVPKFDMYKDLLLSVSRPSRYIGQEINSIRKDLSKVYTRVALIFPDAYEIGMSHLGLKILYHIINTLEDTVAERAFVPWVDLEKVLTEKGLPLVSIESSIPLREFDILGITLPYELCYTNILTILLLSGIPLLSRERDENYPLIVGGGSAVFNPEPVADFFDAFFLGDGEEGVLDIINTYKTWKGSGRTKEELLMELSKIEGLYVPSFYKIEYNEDGTLREIRPEKGTVDKVKRRIVEDLNKVPYPNSVPVPYMQVVHDRLTVEIARGCTRGCRFCQAGITYRPVRERSPEKIMEIIDHSIENTGYEEVSLASLSTGDFACLSQLLTSLNRRYADEHISFSLPSLRIGTLTPAIIDQVRGSKAALFSLRSMQALPLVSRSPEPFACHSEGAERPKNLAQERLREGEAKNASFTVAPEAGTGRLRKVINKEMDESAFEATVEDIFRKGVKSLKMYFMIGLPTEGDEDMEGIINLARKAKDIAKRYSKRGRDVTVSISTFVPKAHTPFQWYGQTPMDEIERKIDYLKKGLMRVGVTFKWHKLEMSYLEAVFSRGNRRLGKVIESAWRSGCRFDSWTESFNFRRWEEAFKECSIDPDFYASRQISVEEILPWEHLDTGVTKEFLIKELKRAVDGRVIPDCRYGVCPNCGVCDMDAVKGRKDEGVRPITRRPEGKTDIRHQTSDIRFKNVGTDLKVCPYVWSSKSKVQSFKVRIRYSKTGDMRMLSQLEGMNTFFRAFRRAHIPTVFSDGFRPHPKCSFGPALPVGVESICEYMDVELERHLLVARLKEDINRCLPEGLRIESVKEILYNTPSLNSFITHYAYEIGFEETLKVNEKFKSLRLTMEDENRREREEMWVPGFSLDRGLRLKPNTQQGFSGETFMSQGLTKDNENVNPVTLNLFQGLNEMPKQVQYDNREVFSSETAQEIFDLSHLGELWVQRVVEKDGKKILREIDTRPFIEDIRWTGKDSLFLLLKSLGGACCRPGEVVEALFKIKTSDLWKEGGGMGVRIIRIGLYGKLNGIMISPEESLGKVEKICLQR